MLIEIADLLHWFIGPIRTIDMINNGRIGRVLTIEWRLLFLLGAFFFLLLCPAYQSSVIGVSALLKSDFILLRNEE